MQQVEERACRGVDVGAAECLGDDALVRWSPFGRRAVRDREHRVPAGEDGGGLRAGQHPDPVIRRVPLAPDRLAGKALGRPGLPERYPFEHANAAPPGGQHADMVAPGYDDRVAGAVHARESQEFCLGTVQIPGPDVTGVPEDAGYDQPAGTVEADPGRPARGFRAGDEISGVRVFKAGKDRSRRAPLNWASPRRRARPGQPCPPGIAAIKLTIAETARLARLARQHAVGLISDARLAFHLRWSRGRRRHQARARWHHYSARLAAAATVTNANRKEVTLCNRRAGTITSQNAA